MRKITRHIPRLNGNRASEQRVQTSVAVEDDNQQAFGAANLELDFQKIKDRAHPVLAKVLRHWYPDGEFAGAEFQIGDVEGNAGSSLKFNTEKGVGKDFSDGWEGGDIISLNAARHNAITGGNWSMADAALDLQQLLERWDVEPPQPGASPQRQNTYFPYIPVPREHEINWAWFLNRPWVRRLIPDDQRTPERLQKWEYRDAQGDLMQYVIRWEENGDKQIRAVTLDRDKMEWRFKQIPEPTPLYGLDRLAARPEAPVLVTEGEKACDAAAQLFPDHVAMTWCRGAKNVHTADWTPLKGRDVVLWPDNDSEGQTAMQAVAARLREIGVERVRVVQLPEGLPKKGWDLADELPKGIDLRALLDGKLFVLPKPQSQSSDTMACAVDPVPPTPKDPIEQMNQTHFVARESGKTSVYNIERDLLFDHENNPVRRTKLTTSSFEDHRNFYRNHKVRVQAGDGVRSVKLGDYWLDSPRRRQYAGIVLAPLGAPEGYYNLWQGWRVDPKPGDWSLFRQHIRENVCQNDRDSYEYLIKWLARLYQRPNQQGEVALVLQGEKGTGKSFFVNKIGYPFGQHYLQISGQYHLAGKFNAHLRDTILLFGDEAFWAGDKQAEGTLRRLITEPTLAIEAKMKNLVVVRNMIHLVLASNEDWVVPSTWKERRFFVLRVGEAHRQDQKYFEAIEAQMLSGGYGAFLYDMLHETDISNFNVLRFPETEASLEQKKLTMHPFEDWWCQKLDSGLLLTPTAEHAGATGDWISGEVSCGVEPLWEDYLKFASKKGERYKLGDTAFGMYMRKLFKPYCKARGITKDKNPWPVKRQYKTGRHYHFPALCECRTAFQEYSETSLTWTEPGSDGEGPI